MMHMAAVAFHLTPFPPRLMASLAAMAMFVLAVARPAFGNPPSGFDPYYHDAYGPAAPPSLDWNWFSPNNFGDPGLPSDPTGLSPVGWEFLPQGAIYPLYLADVKASRLAGSWSGGTKGQIDATLGGRFGILRHLRGSTGPYPHGWQLDFEGAAMPRVSPLKDLDLRSADFRFGLPLQFGFGRLHTRVGYYHLSSHVGDEFLLNNPGFQRLNFSRDVLFAGIGFWVTPHARVYTQAGWGFRTDVSRPWEFEFGIERIPRFATGISGQFFFAVHGHLRQELNYGGHLAAQTGWAWRRDERSGLLRVGLDYRNGKNTQYSFFRDHEQQLGLGLWYDF